MIGQHQRQHGFGDWDEPGQDGWIVATVDLDCAGRACAIKAGGLAASRTIISSPVLMPPRMPPWWLLAVPMLPSARRIKGSLLSEPRMCATPKPSPISTPLIAGMLNMALPISA